MITKIIVPQRGLSDESCVIQEWKKREGERVEKGEIICLVETNKAIFEIESPTQGILLKILYKEGEEIPVMDTIAIIGESEEEEYKHLLEEKDNKIEESLKSEAVGKIATENKVGAKDDAEKGKPVRISPRAYKLAHAKNLDISAIKGSGPEERIIERDVKEAIQRKAQPAIPATEKKEETTLYQKIPIKGIRKIIADKMLYSIHNSAQLTLHSSFSAKMLLEYRDQAKELKETLLYPNININHLIMFGIIKALKGHPCINSYFQNDKIIQFKEIHLGFAVDTIEGLMVPVIHRAEQYSLTELARKIKQLSEQCIDRSILPEDLEQGTFTVTNLGNLGIEHFTPILNFPQIGIIGIGSLQLKPVIKTGDVEFLPHIGLSLTFDHRAIDGAPAARFLQQIITILENFSYKYNEKP